MRAESSRPWLVVVTGEPRKDNARRAARNCTAPPISEPRPCSRRELATAGLWTNQLHDPPAREAAVDTLVEIVETTAGRGVTSVLEFVVTPQRRDALRRLRAAADCLVILATCHDAAVRADRRDRVDPLLSRPGVLAALGHESIGQYLSAPEREVVRETMQSEFDLPLLSVATDDDYDPHLDQVVDWIVDQTRR